MIFLNGFILLFQASISSYLCDNCTKLLTLENNIKIGVCPTDYRLNGLICEKDYPYNIYIRFNDYIDFSNQDIYGLLKVPSGTFLTPGNPFPTKERGFYFPKNSYMICNKSLIPSPILSFQFHIRVFDNGIIFSIEGKNPYLQLLGKELISLNYRYCGINRLCDLAEKIIEYQYPNKAKIQWIHILININESEIGIEMILFLNLVEELRLLLDGENAIGIFDIYEEFYFTVGNEFEGFSGFIYSFEFSFRYYEYYYNFENVNNCDPYFYAENNKCYQTNCTNLSNIWSVREECSVCYTNKCFNCSNYYYSGCSTFECEFGCTQCTSLTCEVCDNNFFKINDGTQTYCSSGIEFYLLKNHLEAHIISGNNKNTDSNNNPDADDPIFTVGRGYYFNGDSFLTTQSSFIIPYSSVINMWVLPISGSIFSKGSILETIYNETSKQLITYISFESNEEFTSSLKKLKFDVVGSEWFSYIIAWSNYYNGIIFHGTQYNKNTFPAKMKCLLMILKINSFLGKDR